MDDAGVGGIGDEQVAQLIHEHPLRLGQGKTAGLGDFPLHLAAGTEHQDAVVAGIRHHQIPGGGEKQILGGVEAAAGGGGHRQGAHRHVGPRNGPLLPVVQHVVGGHGGAGRDTQAPQKQEKQGHGPFTNSHMAPPIP